MKQTPIAVTLTIPPMPDWQRMFNACRTFRQETGMSITATQKTDHYCRLQPFWTIAVPALGVNGYCSPADVPTETALTLISFLATRITEAK